MGEWAWPDVWAWQVSGQDKVRWVGRWVWHYDVVSAKRRMWQVKRLGGAQVG